MLKSLAENFYCYVPCNSHLAQCVIVRCHTKCTFIQFLVLTDTCNNVLVNSRDEKECQSVHKSFSPKLNSGSDTILSDMSTTNGRFIFVLCTSHVTAYANPALHCTILVLLIPCFCV